ncbi:unnamed protein product [Rhizophagus irregularis]|nr:unnamed protein product [Rhizophagus irregularis]
MEKSQNQLWNFNENDDERSLDENDGERNIDEFETDDNLFNDQESKLPNYNEPIFICDYPTRNYPSNVKYTQRSKKNSPVYKIPDKYKVETVLGGFLIICESNYLPNGKIKYSIEWKDHNNISKIISNSQSSSGVANEFYKIIGMKASSKVSGVLLFGFNIPDLIEVRENIDVPIIINRKRPYTEVSTSQKNRRLHSLAKDFKTQSTVILKNNNINNSQLRLIELEIDGKIVIIDFQSRSNFDFITHCDAVLQAIDECLISRQGYRRLAMVDPNIEREYHIEERKHQINKIMNSLIPIHNYTIKITSSSLDQSRENLNPPNINICLLNEKDEVLKPSNQYCILLYIGKEKYEYLSLAVSQIINELDEIKDGFKDCDDVIWTVELITLQYEPFMEYYWKQKGTCKSLFISYD